MSNSIKIALYAVLIILASVFGFLTYSNYSKLMDENLNATKSTSTDVPALDTRPDARVSKGYSGVITYGAIFVGAIIGLGLLLGHEVANYFGNRALKVLYNDEGEGISDPEYEVAEKEWANGHHLEAIRLMREYLAKNSREQHVALRIAEIYEKDLQNYLAAALEYEEVLNHKLPDERWGWAAIHLCNLYFKLDKVDKAVPLLHRIVNEYGETAAAEKARKRLTQMEGEQPGSTGAPASIEEMESPPAPQPPPPQSDSGLPPGFTLKKR